MLLFSFSGQAQFKKLINKAKEKALESVIGVESTDSSSPSSTTPPDAADEPTEAQEAGDDSQASSRDPGQATATPQKPPEIVFPVTGVEVKATHAVIGPVIDGDVRKITATPQGQYGVSVAREKGLKGTDEAVFKQLLAPANYALLEVVDSLVKAKFPGGGQDAGEQAPGMAHEGANPAWGGISAPSLFFAVMMGDFDIWLTDHYIKSAMRHDRTTMADAFGVTGVTITDIDKRMRYVMGSVLGVNFTKVTALDTVEGRGDFSASVVLPLVKQAYLGVQGVTIVPGEGGQFGPYHTVSEKLVIPVQPVVEPGDKYKSNALLFLHDILSNRQDAQANDGRGNYDPSYKVIYEYYYSHDFDKYIPSGLRQIETAAMKQRGMCVGAAIEDERGNRAVFRISDVTADQHVDKGQFQVPADYPVMTDEELQQAIRKKMGAGLLKGLMQSAGDGQ